jgi:hypothetical protein
MRSERDDERSVAIHHRSRTASAMQNHRPREWRIPEDSLVSNIPKWFTPAPCCTTLPAMTASACRGKKTKFPQKVPA